MTVQKTPGILTAYSITSKDLIGYFESLPLLLSKFRYDNGPEMTSREFLDWAHRRKIEIEYLQPGKSIHNAFIDSFNSRFRDECLNEELFFDLDDASKKNELKRFKQEQLERCLMNDFSI